MFDRLRPDEDALPGLAIGEHFISFKGPFYEVERAEMKTTLTKLTNFL